MSETTRQSSSQLLVSRRAFLFGTAAVGTAAAAAGLGLTGCESIGADSGAVSYLKVPETSLVTMNDFEALDSYDDRIQLVNTYEIPYGTLLWANDEEVAACLLPTSSGSPLTQIGLLFFGNGNLDTIVSNAVGASDHHEIYDVRATAKGLIWTEANILRGTWRIYTAALSEGALSGDPVLVEEGDAAYETPMLAVSDSRAFWQVVPRTPNDAGLTSRLMSSEFGRNTATCVYENVRRMGTPPYSSGESVTIAPRLDESTTYFRLTNINALKGETNDTMTLPGGMKPLEAGYGKTGFMFSFANIYDYGEGISNLGTYVPMSLPADGDYSSVQWFGFARTPTAPPAWCNNLLIVKSSYSVCGVNLNEGTYFAIDVDDGAEDYGDYLATTGMRNSFVTYTNIDHKPIGGSSVHCCRVKIWTTVS